MTERIRKSAPAGIAAFACVVALSAFFAVLPAAAGAAGPVWLCKPGIAHNPCEPPNPKVTILSPSGQKLGVRELRRPKQRPIDCFYVYPTVSDQPTPNANLHIDPEERSIALYQAARYSQVCRVFAPMYRQLTLRGISVSGGAPGVAPGGDALLAFNDVLGAWNTYLRRYNHGRGVVLIGHSQGTFLLRELIKDSIDPYPKVRRKLLSAILLGGNVTVKQGQDLGADFQNIGACHAPSQLGCVVAFSTFDAPVPADALFGRTTLPGYQILCTNPAALGGGPAPLKSIVPTAPFAPGTTLSLGVGAVGLNLPPVFTTFVEVDGGYSGQCSSADNANVLQITDAPGSQHLLAIPFPIWGLHLVDANIAQGNLFDLVRREARAWTAARTAR
jgi:Protein of unknown function (DUF3089)